MSDFVQVRTPPVAVVLYPLLNIEHYTFAFEKAQLKGGRYRWGV